MATDPTPPAAAQGLASVLRSLRALGPARLAALAVVALGMLGAIAMIALRGGGESRFALLYADLDPREAAQIAEALDRAHIAHQEPGAGDRILVPAAEVARARLLLARDGLPTGGSIGYEIFDRGDQMTASDFQQQINETRALEGEVARSIRMISGVRAVRVHLVLSRREPFAREVAPAQASVVLTMAGGARLDAAGVQAVLNLVAAAVPGLKPQAVALIDSRGNLLARAGQPTPEAGLEQTGEEIRRATEARLARAVEDMLEQSLGPGRVRAEAAVEMNFDRTQETQEAYNPDQQVVRSTQSVTDESRSTEAEKPVTVQNNLPNADVGQNAQSGSQQKRQEETTNYEIGKTVRTIVREQPQIARISLGVMVDGETELRGGAPAWHERGAEDIARITRLVQSAIGYDAKRGDKVEVVSMRFAPEGGVGTASGAGLFGLALDRADLMGLAQTGLLGGLVLFGLLFVLRPVALRLAGAAPDTTAAGVLAGPAALLPAPGGGHPALPGPGPSGEASFADGRMVQVANIEGLMRASSLRRLGDLVEKHPQESLNIVRAWLTEGRA